jgi:hypothetical protein
MIFFLSTFYAFESKRKTKIYFIIIQKMNFETPKR